ncbi:LysR family transcriptional regulator [Sphingomonas sp. VNH70]|uniref:LysR family transcriptional regulator n=1 Tax=Sphingomonas silueang TaxID=3156617 RepID=UPI0032B31855
MEVRQLRQFVAVAETLHFNRAAIRLNMTQPPLSQSIMALERELGAPLFVRTKRTVALTPFGQEWLNHVREALRILSLLPETAQRLRRGEIGRLELSFVSVADYNVLPALVRSFADRHPEVDLVLQEATSEVQIARLLDGIGHAGIIVPPPAGTLHSTLSYCRLLSEPLIAVVPEHWSEEGRLPLEGGRLHPAEIADVPLVMFPRPSAPALHDLVTDYLSTHGGSPRIAQEAIQMQTIISLVSAGMGIALVPASLRKLARSDVQYIDLAEGAPCLEIGLAWRTDDLTPALQRFLSIIGELQP